MRCEADVIRSYMIDLFGIPIVVLVDDRNTARRLSDARMAAMRRSGELARWVVQASMVQAGMLRTYPRW